MTSEARSGVALCAASVLLLALGFCLPREGEEGTSPAPNGETWPQFRGPRGLGTAPADDRYPLDWDVAAGRNVVWEANLSARGHSSPIVWRERIFLTGEIAGRGHILCFSSADGTMLWDRAVVTLPPDRPLPDMGGGLCAPTPATDGRRVFALFATGDVVCLDVDGKALWSRHLCDPVNSFGLCGSLVLWKGSVIVQLDQGNTQDEGLSAILALDKRTGRKIWSTPRSVPNSWSTPLIIEHGGRPELITCANPFVIAYDPDTGRELWRATGLGGEVVPMPTFAADLVFAANANSSLLAIVPGGRGDVTATRVAWTAQDGLPSMASPLADGQRLLLCGDGELTCYDANSGRLLWQEEEGESFWASPTLVGRNVYLPDQTGKMLIFELGDRYKLLSCPDVGDEITATPAFAGGRIYLRTKGRLFCIGTP